MVMSGITDVFKLSTDKHILLNNKECIESKLNSFGFIHIYDIILY